MSRRYASGTNVSPEKTQMEIRETLRRFGASRFGIMEDDEKAYVMFTVSNLDVQITVPLPAFDREVYGRTPKKRLVRSDEDARRAWQQDIRERWRCLLTAIKSKLVAVEEGIATVEQEFLAYVVLADGETVGSKLLPAFAEMNEQRRPLMLPGPVSGGGGGG